jgi:hypothetical protein
MCPRTGVVEEKKILAPPGLELRPLGRPGRKIVGWVGPRASLQATEKTKILLRSSSP